MYFIRPSILARKLYRKAIWRIPTEEKVIYITFDDGPHPEVTPWVLDTLRKYNAKATFFCVGSNAKKYPDIFQQIISEGHSTGNHTFNHLNGWKTNTADYSNNINKCGELINSTLFRPPYGKLTSSQYSLVNDHYSLIMWDVISGDFDQKVTEEKCLKNVITKTRKGSIVVFHDSAKAKDKLYYTLPKFLAHFSEQGFLFNKL